PTMKRLSILVLAACSGSATPPPATPAPAPAPASVDAAVAAAPSPNPPANNAAPPGPPAIDVSLQEVGLEASSLDRTADPCVDFYQFACGGWMAKNQIPA